MRITDNAMVVLIVLSVSTCTAVETVSTSSRDTRRIEACASAGMEWIDGDCVKSKETTQ